MDKINNCKTFNSSYHQPTFKRISTKMYAASNEGKQFDDKGSKIELHNNENNETL